jgi:hypothetical protein
MSAQMYIARLIDEGRADRGPNGTYRHSDLHRATRPRLRSRRARKARKA